MGSSPLTLEVRIRTICLDSLDSKWRAIDLLKYDSSYLFQISTLGRDKLHSRETNFSPLTASSV